MELKFLDENSIFIPSVIALGKKHSSTLGFMPEGGYEQYAKNGFILVCLIDGSLAGYLMFREVTRYSRVTVVHLCVDEKYRGKNIGMSLMTHLCNFYKDNLFFDGISLNCREDYLKASSIWNSCGFTILQTQRSKSKDEHFLNTWWYAFDRISLFSNHYTESAKVKALLDLNVLLEIWNSESDNYENKGLLADWIQSETEYYYAIESLNEASRDKDKNRSKEFKLWLQHYFAVPVFDNNEMSRTADSLSIILQGGTTNDDSDRKQVATAISSGIDYFITCDKAVLSHSEQIKSQYSVTVLSPAEFLIQIDTLVNSDDYSPSSLPGAISHSLTKISNINECVDVFLKNRKGERKNSLLSILSQGISTSSVSFKTLKINDSMIALYGIQIIEGKVSVPLLRFKNIKKKSTAVMGIMNQILADSISLKTNEISISEKYLEDDEKAIICQFGFSVIGSDLVKHLDYTGKLINSVFYNIKDQEVNIPAIFEYERKLFPMKFLDLDIPTYIVPIKPFWAKELFDYISASEDMFGSDVDKLWSYENVYFRHTVPICEVAPGRILWYVSHDKNCVRSKAIVACSYLVEVETGNPKTLYEKNQRYGVYKWKHINQLCEGNGNKDIRVLKFNCTEVFQSPVPLNKVQSIIGREVTFASPYKIDYQVFNRIYNLRTSEN